MEEEAKANLPAQVSDDYDFGDDAGAGGEFVTAGVLVTPFLKTLQANSPECKPVRVGGIDGAHAGAMFNSATNAIYACDEGEGVGFMACGSEERFVEFYPRDDQGNSKGFVSVRAPDDDVVVALKAGWNGEGETPQAIVANGKVMGWTDDVGRDVQMGKPWNGFGKLRYHDLDGEDTELIQTYSLFGFIATDWDDVSSMTRVCVPFVSSKIMSYRRIMTTLTDSKIPYKDRPGAFMKPPIWAHRLRLTTFLKQRGPQSWYIPVLSLWVPNATVARSLIKRSDPMYVAGREFYEMISKGEVTTKYEETQDEHASTEGGEDVPF